MFVSPVRVSSRKNKALPRPTFRRQATGNKVKAGVRLKTAIIPDLTF